MVGCFTRAASFFAAIFGIYYLGIPQFYGCVDHYHHNIWFMFILSASRCSDVLSIDAIGKSFREADRGQRPEIRSSVEYALPLRFIWLLLGVVYFFPGFWKLSAPGWAWSDNLKYRLYYQWFRYEDWLPFFRLDQYPILYKMASFGAMIFEVSFVFLILVPALRPIAIMGGVLFHSMRKLFLDLNFSTLVFCCIFLINWAALLATVGRWVFKEPFQVSYNGKSKAYRWMIVVLTKFDIFQRVVFIDGQIQEKSTKASVAQNQLLMFIGVALVLINCVFGFRKTEWGWPFTCYPTFSHIMEKAELKTLTPYGVAENKEELISFDFLRTRRLRHFKVTGMLKTISEISDENRQLKKLKALAALMKAEIDLKKYSKIRFYKTTYSTELGKINNPPISKELLAEIDM